MNESSEEALAVGKNSTGYWLARFLSAVVLLTWAFAFFVTLNSALVPLRYLYGFAAAYTVLVLLVLWQLLRLKRSVAVWKRVTVVLLVLSLVLFHATLIRSAYRTEGLLHGLEQVNNAQTEYVIIGPKQGNATLADSTTIGVLADDLGRPGLKEALREQTPAEPLALATITELIQGIEQQDIPLGIMRSSTFEMLGETLPQLDYSVSIYGTVFVESATPPIVDAAATEPFILYLSGLDTYGDIQTSARSDVNMLAAVNPITKKILLVNTPRDYFVQLDGTTGEKDKLTHAGIYGIDVARQTMEDLFGVDVPYYARVNFTSLLELIDIMGPINVYAEQSFGNFSEGMNVLDGEAALEFSRDRYDLEDGDRERGRNQQRVIAAIVMNLSSPRNALKLPQVLDHMQGSFETNLSEASMRELFREQANSGGSWEIENFEVEGSDAEAYTYSMPDIPLYVMIPDQESVEDARGRILKVLAER